jgi:hypothetical protein
MQKLSMCIQGHLVPELYLLGAPKAGTTSLAQDLREAGVASDAEPTKESHFFHLRNDKYKNMCEIAFEPSQWLRAQWLLFHYKACPSDERQIIIGDYTPDNLRLSGSPQGWISDTVGAERAIENTTSCLPAILANWYAGLSPRLTFVVMVREPTERYLSAFYFRNEHLRNATVLSGQFEASVNNSLALLAEKVYDSFFWPSMYSASLERYLEHFAARQFVIVPYLRYFNGGKCAVYAEVSARLGMTLDCQETSGTSHTNTNEHPQLDELLSAPVRQAFRAAFVPMTERLVQLLTNTSLQGLGLPQYNGTMGSESGIREWLLSGW